MTYNPRLYNIDNTINISGNLVIGNINSYLSSSTVSASNINIQNISFQNITVNKINYDVIADYKTNIIRAVDDTVIVSQNNIIPSSDATVILADTRKKDIDIVLPPAADVPGKQYIIKKIDSTNNQVRIKGNPTPLRWKQKDIPASYASNVDLSLTVNREFYNSAIIATNQSGTMVVLGSLEADIGEVSAGALFIYRTSSVGWYQEAVLTSSTNDIFTKLWETRLGTSVSVNYDGTTIAAGIPGANILTGSTTSPTNPQGAVVVFKSGSSGWYQQSFLTGGDGTTSGDSLGQKIAINGDGNLIIASSQIDVPSSNAGGVVIFRSSSAGWRQEVFLTSSGDGAIGSELFATKDIKTNYSGTVVALSYELSDTGGTNAGAVIVYSSSSVGWRQELLLTSSQDGGPAGDLMGNSLDINKTGDIIIASARGDQPTTDSGCVIVFSSSSIGWRQQAYITSSGDGTPAGDLLGSSVSMNDVGDMFIASSPNSDEPNGSYGSITVFRSASVGWYQERILTSSIPEITNFLGNNVVVNKLGTKIYSSFWPSNTLIQNILSLQPPIAVFSTSSAAGWYYETILTSSDYTIVGDDRIGWSMAANQDASIVVAGGPNANSPSQSINGVVNVFKKENNTWVQEAVLTTSSLINEYNVFGIGYSVDINLSGDRIVAGAYDTTVNGVGSGSLLIFTKNNSGWINEAFLTHSGDTGINKDSPDYLGTSVAMNRIGDMVFGGAPYTNIPTSSAGVVVVFRSSSIGWRQETQLTSTYTAPAGLGPVDDILGWSVATNASGTLVAAGAPGRDQPFTSSGGVVIFRSSSIGWRQEAVLTSSYEFRNPSNTGSVGDQTTISNNMGVRVTMNDAGNLVATSLGSAGLYAQPGGWLENIYETVRVFRSGSTGWREEAVLSPSLAWRGYDKRLTAGVSSGGSSQYNSGTGFGGSLKFNIDGNVLIIGAPNYGIKTKIYDGAGRFNYLPGAIFVFRSSSLGWYEETYLAPENLNKDIILGTSVAINDSEDTILGGAYKLDNTSGSYTFKEIGGVIAFEKRISYEYVDNQEYKILSTPYDSITIISDGTSSWKIT